MYVHTYVCMFIQILDMTNIVHIRTYVCNSHGVVCMSWYGTAVLTSQPASSATTAGDEKGKQRMMPFSVPIQRQLWAATMVLMRTTTRDRRRSEWKAVRR